MQVAKAVSSLLRVKKSDWVEETLVKPIDPETLSPKVRLLMIADGRDFITRNSKCVCGSNKRFKKCCGTKK